MEQSIFEKIGTIFQYSTSSFLMLEVLLIFLVVFLFLVFNLKQKRKMVAYLLTILLLYFLLSSFIYYQKDFVIAGREVLKKIVEYFYFSPVPIYFVTIFLASICFIRTLFATGYTKRHKVLSYLLLLPVFFCFVTFIIVSSEQKIEISQLTKVYGNEVALSLIQVGQIFFFLYLGSCFFRYFYHFVKQKIVK